MSYIKQIKIKHHCNDLGGKEGDTNLHLWSLAYTLRYCGFTVKQPVLFQHQPAVTDSC